ncbi:hypothetical protein RQM65_18295 [Pricia sp. S334]|uniref:Uncharacterized protein n=1 Tax=Pricia mediterranea TaxID=3076079 RepID=A0ABU3LBG7_9FLAO|nr:hypothetical protein [Pricia sp. S334]MDT7830626.1 hypothetical protein [Pricia sp. S334]
MGITITKNGFPNINVYVWFLLGKLVPLYLLLIWFLTCRHWWYHIILIPILMYGFQIFEGVISDDNFIDTDNILWLLPFCMILVPVVYFIRIKLYDKYVHGIDLEAMEDELRKLKEKQDNDHEDSKTGSTSTTSTISTSDTRENLITKSSAQTPSPSTSITSEETGYKSFSEKINEKLSTRKLESQFKQLQNQLSDWSH